MRKAKGPLVREARPAEAGTIAGLEPVGRGGRQFEVTMTSGWQFRIDPSLVIDFSLATGVHLDLPTMQRLLDADDLIAAKAVAARQLAYRPRSISELRSTLASRGFREVTIDAVVERFTDLGYLNDEDFARRWIATREAVAPRGKRLLKQELRQKGIGADLVDEALEAADLDDLESARALAERRAAKMGGLDRDTKRRRIAGLLERRGYSYDVVRRVDRELFPWNATDDEEPDEP
ncbi:MAG: recombination regulator RecX [Chloroflexota bacterium]|nr:recombination regulator RecX [Chloroflexota bacterium]